MSIETGAIARHTNAKGIVRLVRVEEQRAQALVHEVDPDTFVKRSDSRWVRSDSVEQKKKPRTYQGGVILLITEDGEDLLVKTTKGIKKLPLSMLESL